MTETTMSYAEFGRAFVHEAVTPERIHSVIRGIAGEAINVGPIHAGPGGVALATAVGHIADPVIEVTSDEPLAFLVRLPVALDLEVAVAGTHHRYDIAAEVRVAFAVRLAPPLSICIEPESPTYRDVDVDVHPQSAAAKVLARAGNIDKELRRHIARYVRERINTDVSRFTAVELQPLMVGVAEQLTRRKPPTPVDAEVREEPPAR